MRRRTHERFVRRRFAVRAGRLKIVGIGLVALAAVAGLGWVVLFSTWLGVHDVSVEGDQAVEPGRVRDAAAVREGTPLARVDSGAIERRVESIRRIESATVHRSWPRTLTIEVTEREAVAVVVENGSVRALDRHGVLFARLNEAPEDLPEIRLSADDAARQDALAEVAEVVTALDPSIARKVERVEVSSMDSIVLELHGGDEVRWGNASEPALKARVLRALLEIPASTYDVSVPERPTTES